MMFSVVLWLHKLNCKPVLTPFLIDDFSCFLSNSHQVTQAEVDPLINKPISTTQEIHPQFSLFTCAPRIIVPDATIPVSLGWVLLTNCLFLE